jgi:hypothetical protein
VSEERRHFERLHLPQPLDGWFGDFPVRLADISASGAAVEHDDAIPPDSRAVLRFYWRGEEVELLAEITRVSPTHAGLRFLEDSETLVAMIGRSAAELQAALEANARGDREANVVFGDETITSAWRRPDVGYVKWLFDGESWRSERALLPDQPENGFTIAASEPEEQVVLLRETYASGDEEARRLTRMLASMSVTPE